MNYKNFIKSRNARNFILSLLTWVPDKIMVKLQYRIHTGRKLNLNHPLRFSEKLQWYKLNYRNPLMHQCTDKIEVRKVVEKLGLKELLIPLIGYYNNISEIDFERLPSQFVAKSSDGGGGNQVFICKDKNTLDKNLFYRTLNLWMRQPKPKKHVGREWAYDNGFPRRIVIEQFIDSGSQGDLIDYKFFCFNGKVKVIYGVSNRKVGESACLGIYDENFIKLDAHRTDEKRQDVALPKPKNFDKMKNIAEILSQNFPEVRVDLYNIEGTIYFGELTFYDGSGYMEFEPDSFDYTFGDFFSIKSLQK